MMNVQQLVSAIGAKSIGLPIVNGLSVAGLCSDSRSDCRDKLFAAIPGENFDGHDYIDAAEKAGATALLVSQKVSSDLPQLLVENVVSAMGGCALAWRNQYDIPVVAITGSAGKTTVKEMLGNVLHAEFGKGVVTAGNFNNEIGVPLTLTQLSDEDNYAVVEMGMNHKGEIARLSKMTLPQFALINNAAAAHLEGVGSLEDVAEAKGEIVEGLSAKGILFINADDQFADKWERSLNNQACIRFGLSDSADVTCTYEVVDRLTKMHVKAYQQYFELHLPLLGEHNVRNALAVIAVALKMNVAIAILIDELEKFSPPKNRTGRYQFSADNVDVTLIDDSYNANLASMRAAINLLQIESEIAGDKAIKTLLLCGDIGELGEQAAALHRDVGAYANKCGIQSLWATGEFSEDYAKGYGANAQTFVNKDALIQQLMTEITSAASEQLVVLVKGSRFTKMEKVVEAIKAHFSEETVANNGQWGGVY